MADAAGGQRLQQQVPALQLQLTLDVAEAAARRGDWQAVLQHACACSEQLHASHAALPGAATQLLLLQARAAMQLGLQDTALQALDLALMLSPECTDALALRARLHGAAGRATARFLDVRRLSELAPHTPGLLAELQQASRAASEARRAAVRGGPPRRTYTHTGRRGGHGGAGGGNPAAPDAAAAAHAALGLAPGASREAVRAAYKQRALQLHPDKLGESTEAERAAAADAFQAVVAARRVLLGE